MTKKSKFLKSAKLAIAGVVLASGLSACHGQHDKHNCKMSCSSKMKKEKAGCASKDGKSGCSSSVKEDKASCSSAKNKKE